MAATIELFKFDIYHGAEIHVRILGGVSPTKLTLTTDKETVEVTSGLHDGVKVFRFTGYNSGTHTLSATLTDDGMDYTESTSFSVPEPESVVTKPSRFKDWWIAIGQPGAYTNANTYVNGLGQVKPYYERVIAVFDEFGIRIKHTPYSIMPKAKNISTQSWPDEDGDDIWLPRITTDVPGEYAPQLTHEVVQLEPTFVIYFPDNNVMKAEQQVTAFIKAIEGRWLKIYDEYTHIGYTGVTLVDADDDPKFKRRNYDYAEFSLTFKVNGPNITEPFEGIKLD